MYSNLTSKILQGIQLGQCAGVTSVIALMDLTVQPWRRQQSAIAREYETLLVNFPNLFIADVTRNIGRRAAQLRAWYNIRPADALLIAKALTHGATVWITNDRHLRRLGDRIDVILLDDYLPAENEP